MNNSNVIPVPAFAGINSSGNPDKTNSFSVWIPWSSQEMTGKVSIIHKSLEPSHNDKTNHTETYRLTYDLFFNQQIYLDPDDIDPEY